MRFAGIILACILYALTSPTVQAAQPLSRAESTICKSVKHCVDIIERHTSDSYDYAALHSEFLRFRAKGKTALLKMLSSKNETDMERAQDILARGRFRFTPDEQREIAALWPRGDLDTHANIMLGSLSPLMRTRAIETLNDKDKAVSFLSREIIDASVQMKMDFPLRPSDFAMLARAAFDNPTPGLVQLLSTYGSIKTDPIFTRILQSGDGPSTIAAYEKLYAADAEKAFKSLVGTLYALKEDKVDAAFALSSLLRHRHKSRPDGFYLKFASDIAQDPKMSSMGRLAGLDTLLNQNSEVKATTLPTTSSLLEVFMTALENTPKLQSNYIANIFNIAGKTPDPWLNVLWLHLKSDPYKNPDIAEILFEQLGNISTPKAKIIISETLADKRDFGLINLAIIAAAKQGDASHIPALKSFSNHPISDIRAHALSSLAALNEDKASLEPVSVIISRLNSQAQTCRANPKDFKAEVKNLPFFDLKDDRVERGGPRRNYVSTVHPTKSGWLVGYAADKAGGDLQYYDNASGQGRGLKENTSEDIHNNVDAILPVTPQPLGQYAREFWVFMTDGRSTNNAAVYRLSETNTDFRLIRHAQLPDRHLQIAPQSSGDVFISFYKGTKHNTAHPPLLLSPNGGMRRACETPPANNQPSKKASP